MVKYVFKEGPITLKNKAKASPQIIGEALNKIAESNGGALKPKAVLESARNNRHPLHKHFEWDDALAAESYRLDQARELIRVVRVEDDDAPEGFAPAFHSITDRDGTAYRTNEEVKNSADLQMIVLRQAQRDLDAFTDRYRELKDICQIVQTAREKVSERLNKNETRAAA